MKSDRIILLAIFTLIVLSLLLSAAFWIWLISEATS